MGQLVKARSVRTSSGYLLLLGLLLSSISGCSTLKSKYYAPSEVGHAYSGVRYNVYCSWPETIHFGADFPIGYVISIPLQTVDSVLTVVADTLFLPVDLFVEGSVERHPCPPAE